MNTLLIAALSILFWQLVVTLVYVISDENEEITMRTAIGFWLLPIMLFSFIYRKTRLMLSRKYNLYQFFSIIDGSPYNGWVNNYYMTPKTASKFARVYNKDEEVKENYSIRLLKEGKEFKSVLYRQEILTWEDIENGTSSFPKNYLAKFLNRD